MTYNDDVMKQTLTMIKSKKMNTTRDFELIREADCLAKATGMDFRLCLEILYKAGGEEQKEDSQDRPESISNKRKGN